VIQVMRFDGKAEEEEARQREHLAELLVC
jgi:hypothetical protein